LIPRVKELGQSLGALVPLGEVKEEQRRKILERYFRSSQPMFNLTYVGSKLDDILKDLIPLAQRGKVTRFLNNAEDVEKLSGMVEDIRDAMMEYQVCS
jgi:hypothetical protein